MQHEYPFAVQPDVSGFGDRRSLFTRSSIPGKWDAPVPGGRTPEG